MTLTRCRELAQWNANFGGADQESSHGKPASGHGAGNVPFIEMVTDRNKKIYRPWLRLRALSSMFHGGRGYTQNLYAIQSPDKGLDQEHPGHRKEVDVRVCMAEQIDFESEMFDVVFVYSMSYTILKRVAAYREACREICRNAKPGRTEVFIMGLGQYQVFRAMEGGVKVLGYVSQAFKAFSECLDEATGDATISSFATTVLCATPCWKAACGQWWTDLFPLFVDFYPATRKRRSGQTHDRFPRKAASPKACCIPIGPRSAASASGMSPIFRHGLDEVSLLQRGYTNDLTVFSYALCPGRCGDSFSPCTFAPGCLFGLPRQLGGFGSAAILRSLAILLCVVVLPIVRR